MIVAYAGEPSERRLIILGITPANIRELKRGRPLRVSADSHPGGGMPENLTFSIVFGETERAIVEAMQKAGAITEHTKVIALPRKDQRGEEEPS